MSGFWLRKLFGPFTVTGSDPERFECFWGLPVLVVEILRLYV